MAEAGLTRPLPVTWLKDVFCGQKALELVAARDSVRQLLSHAHLLPTPSGSPFDFEFLPLFLLVVSILLSGFAVFAAVWRVSAVALAGFRLRFASPGMLQKIGGG